MWSCIVEEALKWLQPPIVRCGCYFSYQSLNLQHHEPAFPPATTDHPCVVVQHIRIAMKTLYVLLMALIAWGSVDALSHGMRHLTTSNNALHVLASPES